MKDPAFGRRNFDNTNSSSSSATRLKEPGWFIPRQRDGVRHPTGFKERLATDLKHLLRERLG